MKERNLSEAERRRLARFDATSEELVTQGYERINLDISIMAANVVAIAATVALFVAATAKKTRFQLYHA